MIELNAEMLAIIERTHLERNAHSGLANGACAMELVSYIAGERWSDHPECVCPVLGAFVRAWNDALPDDDRNAILKPLLSRLIGTRGSAALAERRSLMAADWLVRVHTPAWLRLAKLDAQADALAGLPEIMAMTQIPSIRGPIEAVQRDAAAARDAARDAAGAAAGAASVTAARTAAKAAARDAAWDAAVTAAGTAAWDAARIAAWDAAVTAAWTAVRAAVWNAAGTAAGTAAENALRPTQLLLQQSARELIERMIDAPVNPMTR